MNDTRRIRLRTSLRAALICFLWTIGVWLVLFAVTMVRRRGLTASGASLLSFGVPVLAGVLAYQLVMVPWLAGDGVSARSRFFWMILAPCAIVAAILFIAR